MLRTARRLSPALLAIQRRNAATAAEVWTEINALAAQPGMINMGQGFPDFDGSLVAREAAASAILSGGANNQYSPQAGLPELRRAVSEAYGRVYPSCAQHDPDKEVVIVTSGQEGLTASLRAILDVWRAEGQPERDGVLVLEPYYPFLRGALEMAGATPQPVRLQPPGFAFCADAIRAAITPRTGAIVLNSPHNPTGHVATPSELEACRHPCNL